MKKVFISVPMRDRTPENIELTYDKLLSIAKALWGDGIEMISSYNPDYFEAVRLSGVTHPNIYMLANSVQKMAEADYFIGVDTWEFDGCVTERDIANRYGIPVTLIGNINDLLPDWDEIIRKSKNKTEVATW